MTTNSNPSWPHLAGDLAFTNSDDTLHVTLGNPYVDTNFVILLSSNASTRLTSQNKTVDGFDVHVSPRITGTVEWATLPHN